MSSLSSWESVWNRAQPRLASIRETLSSDAATNPRILRVGQLDSELLDQELVHLLQEPLNKTLALVNTSFRGRLEPELALLLQLTLYKLSIWNSGASYGAKLQDLRYTVPPSLGYQPLTPSGIPRRLLLIHGALTILMPYFHTRLRSYALSHAWPDAPSSDRRRKAWDILNAVESSHTLLGLINFVAFLWDGRFRTIADRLLNMSLIPSRRLITRDVSYEFMNRQMVWHAFTEFLLFLLPLINARSIRRRLNRLTSLATQSVLPDRFHGLLGIAPRKDGISKNLGGTPEPRGKYWSLPQDQCAICAENASYSLDITNSANAFTAFASTSQPPADPTGPDASTAGAEDEPPPYPVYTPYITSCGHIYCYHCISERMMRAADELEDEGGWACLRCTQPVKSSERFEVEVEMGSDMTGSDYDFSSDFDSVDVTDLSGSVGSYSESGLSDDYH